MLHTNPIPLSTLHRRSREASCCGGTSCVSRPSCCEGRKLRRNLAGQKTLCMDRTRDPGARYPNRGRRIKKSTVVWPRRFSSTVFPMGLLWRLCMRPLTLRNILQKDEWPRSLPQSIERIESSSVKVGSRRNPSARTSGLQLVLVVQDGHHTRVERLRLRARAKPS